MMSFNKFKTLPKKSKQRIVVRYTLFQIPDLAILILILLVLRWWIDPRSWLYGVIVGLWIIKDVLIFPFVWRAYDRPRPGDLRSLIGTEGIAEERLDSLGYVRVHGELWQAKVMAKGTPIEKGEKVQIQGSYGLTLLVQPTQEKCKKEPSPSCLVEQPEKKKEAQNHNNQS